MCSRICGPGSSSRSATPGQRASSSLTNPPRVGESISTWRGGGSRKSATSDRGRYTVATRSGRDCGGLDRPDVREEVRPQLPVVALVRTAEHLAGARSKVDAGRPKAVRAHRFAQHGHVRIFCRQPCVELVPRVAPIAAAPDGHVAIDHVPAVLRISEWNNPERLWLLRMDGHREAKVGREV